VAGSNTWQNQVTLFFQPGLSVGFPWLSTQAQSWEQYRFHKLEYTFVPIASTATNGNVLLAPEYDVTDTTPLSEVSMSEMEGSVETPCWVTTTIRIDCAAMFAQGSRKFVRSIGIAGDQRLYDGGKLYVSTVNEANTNPIGKIYVTYDVEFFKPQRQLTVTSQPTQTAYGYLSGPQTFTTATPAPLAYDMEADPLGIGACASGIWTPSAGFYFMTWCFAYSNSATTNTYVAVNVLRNSAIILGTPQVTDFSAATGGDDVSINGTAMIYCGGSDTIQLSVTITAGSGTLTVPVSTGLVTFTLA
jgi:hypothetical protein